MTGFADEKVKPSRYKIIRWFELDQFIPEHAVTSYWVSPKVLFAIRFLLALYSTVVIWTYLGLVAEYTDIKKFFSQFTTLTFIGLHAYLITSTVHSFRYLRSKNLSFLINQPNILNYLYVYLYCTVITYNILTPVVFWAILASRSVSISIPVVTWLNVSIHGVSFFLMLIDVIFNRMKVPIRMVLFVFSTVLLYMFLTFIIYGSTDKWVYPFLDWDQGPKTAIYYFVVAAIIVVAFFVMKLIHMFRDWVASKTCKANPKIEDSSFVEP